MLKWVWTLLIRFWLNEAVIRLASLLFRGDCEYLYNDSHRYVSVIWYDVRRTRLLWGITFPQSWRLRTTAIKSSQQKEIIKPYSHCQQAASLFLLVCYLLSCHVIVPTLCWVWWLTWCSQLSHLHFSLLLLFISLTLMLCFDRGWQA